MSLAIDIDKVATVLLADGWHTVEDDSFDIDAYEYVAHPDGRDTGADYRRRRWLRLH